MQRKKPWKNSSHIWGNTSKCFIAGPCMWGSIQLIRISISSTLLVSSFMILLSVGERRRDKCYVRILTFAVLHDQTERNRDILKCISIWLMIFMLCLLSTILTANPLLPNRPVRPIRWRYVSLSAFPSMSNGRSKLTTRDTCSTSIPVINRATDGFGIFILASQHKDAVMLKSDSFRLPLEHTFVVTSTFSLPFLKRSMTAALCSTVISPLSNATWWPSLVRFAVSQAAILRVWRESNS